MARGSEVGDGFDDADIHMEGMANQFFAIAGDGAAEDAHAAVRASIDFAQLAAHDVHRVAVVGGIIGVKQLLVFRNQRQLGGGAAAVDAQISAAAVAFQIAAGHGSARVPRRELFVLRLVFKQGR